MSRDDYVISFVVVAAMREEWKIDEWFGKFLVEAGAVNYSAIDILLSLIVGMCNFLIDLI